MKSRNHNTLGALALTVGSLTGGAAIAGSAGAATTPDDSANTAAATTVVDDSESTTAGEGVAPDDQPGADGRHDRIVAALQPLIDDGTLTAEQAALVADALDSSGPTGTGAPRGWHVDDAVLATASEALGITPEELTAALADGQSIADIADTEGVDVQTVIDALVATYTERIEAGLADGTLTEEQATARLAELEAFVTAEVERVGGPGRDGHGPSPSQHGTAPGVPGDPGAPGPGSGPNNGGPGNGGPGSGPNNGGPDNGGPSNGQDTEAGGGRRGPGNGGMPTAQTPPAGAPGTAGDDTAEAPSTTTG